VFLVEVPDRSAATLEREIRVHILPGSHIVSDGWASYVNIERTAGGIYKHDVVVHDSHFVDPNDAEVHTQNAENMWSRAKRKIQQ